MKNNYFKVNRRYVFVCLAFLLTVAILRLDSHYVNAETKPSIFGDIFHSVMPAGDEPITQSPVAPTLPPGAGTPTVTPGGIPTNSGLIPASIPIAIPPQCQTKLNRAMANMTTHQNNISSIYIPTEMATGVSWEIVATLHYLETGGSLDPNYSVLTGARIGAIETVIDANICAPGSTNPLSQYTIRITSGANTGCGFDSVMKSSLYAATLFKDKYSMARTLNSRNGFDITTDNDFKLLVGALASYNGFTQGECEISTSTLLYSGNRWDNVIPNRNQCKPKYAGEDHVYGLYCLTDYYTNMYFHFHFGGNVIPYDQQGRVGGITFIHGLQEKYLAQPQSTPTTPPGTPSPPSLPGNPAYGNDIIQEVRSIYGAPIECSYSPFPRLCIEINSANVARIMNAVSKARQPFKNQILRSANNQGTLQCVGAAFGLSAEINGVIPQVGHNAACQFTDTTNTHQFYRYGDSGVVPQAGDLVVWNPSAGVCSNTNAGHIAYIMEVLDAENVVVGEGSWGRRGNISVRTVRFSSGAPIGFLRKK